MLGSLVCCFPSFLPTPSLEMRAGIGTEPSGKSKTEERERVDGRTDADDVRRWERSFAAALRLPPSLLCLASLASLRNGQASG